MTETTIFEINKTIRTFIKSGVGITVAYLIYLSIIHLADNQLLKVNVIFDTFLQISGSVHISWTLTGASGVLVWRYKRLMKLKVKELAPYKKLVEEKVWEARISSGINNDGTTREEDK